MKIKHLTYPFNHHRQMRTAQNARNEILGVTRFWTNFSLSPQNCEFSNSLKMGLSIISKNSLRDSQKFAQPQNRVCISQKRSQKDSNLQPLSAGWDEPHRLEQGTASLQLHLSSLSEIELMLPIITHETAPFSRVFFQNVHNFPDVTLSSVLNIWKFSIS